MSIERALARQELSWTLQADGRFEEAAAAARDALHIVEDAEGAALPDVANLLNDLADIERERQNIVEALALVERARSVEDALGDRFVGDTAARIRTRTLEIAGTLHRMTGDYARAELDLQNALAISIGQFGNESEEAAEARNNLAVLYKYWGRFDAGLQLYTEALTAIVALKGRECLAAGPVYHNIGGILHARGDCAAADEPGRTAWDISRRVLGEDHPRTIADATAYAAILDGLERYDESGSSSLARPSTSTASSRF